MPNTWIDALRSYNKRHNNKFCIPKKNTDEFAKVKKLQKQHENLNKIKISTYDAKGNKIAGKPENYRTRY